MPLYFKNEELSLHNGTEIPIALEDETGAGARRIVFVRKDEDWGVKYKGVPLVVIGVYGCEGSGDTAEYWTELIVASTQGLETVGTWYPTISLLFFLLFLLFFHPPPLQIDDALPR